MERKNLIRLIKAYSRALDKCNQLPDMVLAGPKSHDYNRVINTINASNLKDRVKLTGYVDEHSLPVLYRHARALVYPSLAEGFGLPVLQALCCGCPVACSDLPVLREVGQAVPKYFSPESIPSMARALDPGNFNKQVPEDFREDCVKKYAWNRVAQRHLELFQEMLSS